MNRKGMRNIASAVIEIAFKDLSGSKQLRKSSISFFESPFFLALFCDLADIECLPVYNKYRILTGKKPVSEQSQEWLSKGDVGIYRNGNLIAVTATVGSACEICGVTPPTLYKYARTGKTTAHGYQVKKSISKRPVTSKPCRLRIEIKGDGVVRYATGYRDAARLLGVDPSRMQYLLDQGRYKGFELRRMRGYRHGNTK